MLYQKAKIPQFLASLVVVDYNVHNLYASSLRNGAIHKSIPRLPHYASLHPLFDKPTTERQPATVGLQSPNLLESSLYLLYDSLSLSNLAGHLLTVVGL